jgi:heme exporter protein D
MDIHYLILIAPTALCLLILIMCGIDVYKILRDCRHRKDRRQRIAEVHNVRH